MGLQSDAIESRLEGLKLDDRRIMFDSKLRAIREDAKPLATVAIPTSKQVRRPEPEYPVDRVVSLLEELSRRIEGLEKKHRSLGEEIRQRDRHERRWRSMAIAGGVITLGLLGVAWWTRAL